MNPTKKTADQILDILDTIINPGPALKAMQDKCRPKDMEGGTTYRIWYQAPETASFFKTPEFIDPGVSHHPLFEFKARDLEDVFVKMQGEEYSPNGEARELIEAMGLAHTSLSVGDVVAEVKEDGNIIYHACDCSGWVEIGTYE